MNPKPPKIVAFLILIVVLGLMITSSCSLDRKASSDELSIQQQPVWPTQGWLISSPEKQGISSNTLAAMFEEISAGSYAIDTISIVRNGYLVADAYRPPFNKDQHHIIHSCTKSIVSGLIGIAIDQGYIKSVDVPILSIFYGRQISNLDADKEQMSIEDLLTMTSGFECRDSYLYQWSGLRQMRRSQDWIQYMLDLPMSFPPGEYFEYCNGASFLLSAIIQETTGMSALDFASKHLFNPLGISDVDWPANPQGINAGWGEMNMRPHDMAKIGYLYLHDGYWDDTQVIPSEWVDLSTRKHVDGTLQDGYGYQWWITPNMGYMALGYAGQFIFVLPDLDLVVVFTSDLKDEDFYLPQLLLKEYIIPAVKSDSSLPYDAKGQERLEISIDRIAHP